MPDRAIPYQRPVGPLLAARNERPPVPLPRELAVWLVLRLALMLVGGYEVGVNDGPLVRLFHRVTRTQAGSAWCAAVVSFCLFLLGAFGAAGDIAPPCDAYCPNLAAWGEQHGVLDAMPERGDIVLFWHQVPGEPRPRFAHTAFVLAVHPDGVLETVEGNTNTDGSREGWQQCKKTRRLGPGDRVVHWHHLLPPSPGGLHG